MAYHTVKFVFQRKELVIFDLISFWEQNERDWSAIFLLCQMKLSRTTVIMSLQVCLIPKKCLQGIFFSCRKAELQRTLCPCSKVESAVLSWSWQIYLTCFKKKACTENIHIGSHTGCLSQWEETGKFCLVSTPNNSWHDWNWLFPIFPVMNLEKGLFFSFLKQSFSICRLAS